jgi:ribosomal protein L40E
MTRDSGSEGVDGISQDKIQWVTCRNGKCEANYEMQMREYYRQLEEIGKKSNTMMMVSPALICEKCGEESIYKAFKCIKCETVFEGNIKRGDFADRCPKCGYSDIKIKREENAAGGGTGKGGG